jgi:hypothetical protein
MNHKFKQVEERANKTSKSLFRGSSSSTSRREGLLRCVDPEVTDCPITLQISDDEEIRHREEDERVQRRRRMKRRMGMKSMMRMNRRLRPSM